MILRAVGESDVSAHSIGYDVIKVRYLAVLFGGAMAGLGGAFLSLSYTPMWVEEMTAGRGWIALALVVFASWRPWRLLLGAYLFGGVTILQLYAQGAGTLRRAGPGHVDAALSRDDRRAGGDRRRPLEGPPRRARLPRQAVPSRNLINQRYHQGDPS